MLCLETTLAFPTLHPLFQPASTLSWLVAPESSQKHQHLFEWLDSDVSKVHSQLSCRQLPALEIIQATAAETYQASSWKRENPQTVELGALHFNQVFLLGLARKRWLQKWRKKKSRRLREKEYHPRKYIAYSMLKHL